MIAEMTGEPEDLETLPLLQQWHAGDRAALDRLLERDLPWVRSFIERRIGELLRRKGETDDYVQDALLRVLDYVPRFLIADRRQFRALLGKICENTIRDRVELHRAMKRDVGRERDIPRDSVLALDPTAKQVTRVSMAVDQQTDASWLRLAIEMLDPVDRRLILLRDWEQMQFGEIAEILGLSEDAARMRYRRVLPVLAVRVEELRRGEIAAALRLGQDAGQGDTSPTPAKPHRPDSGLALAPSVVTDGCWVLLDRAVERDLEARRLYMRVFKEFFVPVVREVLHARWGAAATKDDVAAVVRELTETMLQNRPPSDAPARARGTAAYLRDMVLTSATSIESRAHHLQDAAKNTDAETQRDAYRTAWACTVVRAAARTRARRDNDDRDEEHERFRAELLRLHLEEGVSLATLSSRWSIESSELLKELAAARAELVTAVVDLARFFTPALNPSEVGVEAERLLASAASARLAARP